MDNFVAAKILLKGIENSLLKRDGKTLNEIISSCRSLCQINDVQLSELKTVAEMKISELIKKYEGSSIEPIEENAK